jgi:hypothetical protein
VSQQVSAVDFPALPIGFERGLIETIRPIAGDYPNGTRRIRVKPKTRLKLNGQPGRSPDQPHIRPNRTKWVPVGERPAVIEDLPRPQRPFFRHAVNFILAVRPNPQFENAGKVFDLLGD